MKNGTCPKCNSHAIIKNQRIPDRGHYSYVAGYLFIKIIGKRISWFKNHVAIGGLRAWICGECGYTELYTTNFKDLLEADQEAKTSGKKP